MEQSPPMIFLASRSPQRQAILARAGITHQVVISQADEEAVILRHPQALALERARRKAQGVQWEPLLAAWTPADAILAADTVVSHAGRIYGNPHDRATNIAMLQALSGTTHTVTTAHCCWIPPRHGQPAVEACGVALAQVTMRTLSQAEIEAYVDTGEGLGKAGGYAIQQGADRFVVDRQGDFDTVVGLHLPSVRRLYRECTGQELG